jgi:hypothetical protein
MPVVFKRRWGDGRVAEARMPVYIRRRSMRDIPAGGVHSVMESAAGYL